MLRWKVTLKFGFEDLEVWKKAIEFADQVIDLIEYLDTDRKHFRLIEQLEAASTSVAMNIAEGKGRYSKKEFRQFLYIARGSLCETITLLAIFRRLTCITSEQYSNLEDQAKVIVKMIVGLAKSLNT